MNSNSSKDYSAVVNDIHKKLQNIKEISESIKFEDNGKPDGLLSDKNENDELQLTSLNLNDKIFNARTTLPSSSSSDENITIDMQKMKSELKELHDTLMHAKNSLNSIDVNNLSKGSLINYAESLTSNDDDDNVDNDNDDDLSRLFDKRNFIDMHNMNDLSKFAKQIHEHFKLFSNKEMNEFLLTCTKLENTFDRLTEQLKIYENLKDRLLHGVDLSYERIYVIQNLLKDEEMNR